MLVEVFLVWLLVWVIFLIMSTIGSKGWIFAAFSGLWAIFIALHLTIDGLQIQQGMNIVENAGNYTVSYAYSDLILPFSTYSFLWGMFFLLIGMYLVFIAVVGRSRWR